MKRFEYRTYNEYLANLCGLAQTLRVQYKIPAKMEVLANKKGQQVYRLAIDGTVDANSFADIVWAGVIGVGCYLPEGIALYFGDETKSFRASAKKEKEGMFVAMTVNGYDGKEADDTMLGEPQKAKLSELARKVADVNHAGYYVGFVKQNEELTKSIFASDLLGDKHQTTGEM